MRTVSARSDRFAHDQPPTGYGIPVEPPFGLSQGLKPVRKCHWFVGRRIGYSTYVMDANDTRYVLAIGEDAPVVESAEGVAIIERSPGVVLVEADAGRASALVAGGEYVHIYRSPADAHRAFVLFEQTA